MAILEFFHDQGIAVQQPVMEAIESIATFLGHIIEDKHVEQKLEALFELAPDAEIVTDQTGKILMANQQSLKLFGYVPEELLGQAVEVLVPQGRRPAHVEHRLGYIAAPHPRPMGIGMELTALRKDGSAVPVEVSLSPISTEEEILIACAIRDITERKKLEERLRQGERLADVGTLAATFAHEIASPLNGISTTVQLLEKKLPADCQPLISGLSTEIRRLESLLTQFRSLSRIGDLKLGLVNLAGIIRRVSEINAAHWGTLGVRVAAQVPSDLTLMADEEKLYQVILNLTRNAVDAMPEGGILSIRAYEQEGDVIVEISDTGCGIPQDIDIFQPFTTGKTQGTGLGLHIVRQIVSAHHGKISYRSAPGSGTTFELRLPRIPN